MPCTLRMANLTRAAQLLGLCRADTACGAQTDLRVETVHLRRFYSNFASVRSSVTPPLPLPGMDTEAVLVETYEAGEGPSDISQAAQKAALTEAQIMSCAGSHRLYVGC